MHFRLPACLPACLLENAPVCLPCPTTTPQDQKDHLLGLFDWLVPVCLRFVRRDIKESAPTLDGNLVQTLMRTFAALTRHFLVSVLPAFTLATHWL